MNIRKRCASNNAYLLFEVMVTICVISISLIAIMHGISSSVFAAKTVRNYMHAAILLENKMWEFEKEKEIMEGTYAGNFDDHTRFDWKTTIQGVVPDETAKTQYAARADATKLNLVTVTVSWMDRNKPRTLSMSTYMRAAFKKDTDNIAPEKPAQLLQP